MDVVGSEIGHKMRSAIKAKLTELGCYVDDELPDYVMVMVANKRTRAQMEDDLQLFLGDNTELFVNWLHQVLKKLQEVTVTTPLKAAEIDKSKERSQSKDRKPKEKKSKEKVKKSEGKKAKKKEKEKSHHKKEGKKPHKSKKKSKHHEMIRPNIPPLLMNIEKESEPSITDVFAGQILKNHGITLDMAKEDAKQDTKPVIQEIKRPMLPIIDPATITSQPEAEVEENIDHTTSIDVSEPTVDAPKEDQIDEINKIEAKIQGLKQKLAEQLDSMSDDEDFLNIRTEAEELMNDFAEDVFQEISQQAPPVPSPPIQRCPTPSPPAVPKPVEVPPEPVKETPETLPQIELKLPKRPVRERLGTREAPKKLLEVKDKEPIPRTESPERFTPERDLEFRPSKSARNRLGEPLEPQKKHSGSDDAVSEKSDLSNKRLTSKVSVLESRPSRSTCASVVRVRPRPRVGAPASNLLLKAVADAHKSLLNAPAKLDTEPHKVKRALVLPMRRCVDAQKIVIQVPGGDNSLNETGDSISLGDVDSDDDKSFKVASDVDKDEYTPGSITKKITNDEYMPLRNEGRTTTRKDETLIIETINIHNPTVDKDKNTQFIVTMDGFSPNAFLAKKLLTEGLLNEEDDVTKPATNTEIPAEKPKEKAVPNKPQAEAVNVQEKRLSNTSDESETQVIIKKEEDVVEKRKSIELSVKDEVPPVKKRKASPIVFDVAKKEKEVERVRERTESASSDSHVIVTTAPNTHKYDAVPPLSAAERKLVWCRAFPLCRYGASCAFAHPRCKFAAACTRRGCAYSHTAADTPTPPSVASHVVPAANYKSISAGIPNLCKYYPNCVNPLCHYYHPKPCRYGKACINKNECNFYHSDAPHTKWRYPV